jgi:hypothetical protein
MNAVCERFRMVTFSSGAYRPPTSLICWTLGLQVLEKNGGDDGTRTRGLCRDRLGAFVFSATYILNGGCQVAVRNRKNQFPVGKFVGRNFRRINTVGWRAGSW